MGTNLRPELSGQNKYWIEKHRYYELKHFCLQYPIWKKAYRALDGFSHKSASLGVYEKIRHISNPTADCAEARIFYSDRMSMVESVSKETDSELADYILKGVTEGISYDHLKARYNIPCCKDVYYDLYRKFFWLLSEIRG